MSKLILPLSFLLAFVFGCSSQPTENRSVASASMPQRMQAPKEEELEQLSELTIEEIEASMGVTSPESRDDQLAEYFASLCEKNPMDCLHQAGGRGTEIRATLLKKKNRYYLDVQKNGVLAYSCLASPGTRGFLGLNPEQGLTPIVTNINPHGMAKLHIVSSAKSYAGAKMPWTVWVIGGVAIHAGKPTGFRKSHGCINLSYECAERFYKDVASAGLRRTFITVQDN